MIYPVAIRSPKSAIYARAQYRPNDIITKLNNRPAGLEVHLWDDYLYSELSLAQK
jgi:hypothetical protein